MKNAIGFLRPGNHMKR